MGFAAAPSGGVTVNAKVAEALSKGLMSPIRSLDPKHAAGHTPRPGRGGGSKLTPRDKGYQTPMYRHGTAGGAGQKGRKVVSPVAFRRLDFGPDGAL